MSVTPDEIASAAVVVALASAVYAGVSARAAKRSAAAAEGSLQIEREQHLRASRPELSGEVRLLPGGRRELRITLDSDEPLTGMDIWISHGQNVWFHGQPGVHPPAEGETVPYRAFAYAPDGRPGGLQPRQALTWPLLTARGRIPSQVKVEADCRGERGRRWNSVFIEARLVQTDPTQTIW